jgi:hypothetical protein
MQGGQGLTEEHETRPGGFGQNLSATDNDTADRNLQVCHHLGGLVLKGKKTPAAGVMCVKVHRFP